MIISEEDVIWWLQSNPEFFKGKEALLCQMELEHPCSGAESLLTYQLQRLRQQMHEQDERYHELLSNARDNEKRLRRMERLLISLLEAETLEELASVLAERLQSDFGIPWLRLWSYTPLPSLELASHQQQEEQLQLLNHQQANCLSLNPESSRILGLDEQAAQSAAVCLLSHTRPLGLMVLAHPDPQHFRQQQDTLFVEYLGSILSRLLAKEQQRSHQPTLKQANSSRHPTAAKPHHNPTT